LYELLWNVLIGFALIYLDKRFKLGHGRVFALYVSFYSLGRLFVEDLRIDEARLILGLRFNIFTSLVVIVGGLVYFALSNKYRPGQDKKLFRS
jgi:prolipoprotein diacylglyceryltransferase